MLTLQQTDNNLTITDEEAPPPLPQVFSDVRRAYKGYRVYSEAGWKFYASDCLSEEEVGDLEDWLIGVDEPDRKRAA